MNVYYTTAPTSSAEFLRLVLKKNGLDEPILRSPNGKPYLASGALHFSVTHTDGLLAVAVSKQEVGIDAERPTTRRIDALKSRLAPEEQDEDFYELWTAKEAYVKHLGGTLAALLPRLTYTQGNLFLDGAPLKISLCHFTLRDVILCLCTERTEEVHFVELP